MRHVILWLLGWLCPKIALAMSVVFINPGKSDEVYWLSAARAMEAAALSLGVSLEVIYAERDHPKAIEIARKIAERAPPARPDYVIFTNDYGTAPEILRILDGAKIKSFTAFSGIYESTVRQKVGLPRQHYAGWLGSLEPKAEEAGYLTARELIQVARRAKAFGSDGRLHMVAVSGDRSTPTSVRRSEGMRRAIAEASDVVLDQEIHGAWGREKAAEQAAWLYQRHPEARLVWAGNDLMAFGAMQSWRARGGKPGKDAWFSGINTSSEAMTAIQSGELSALAGGHFIAGAWALVMLYDYHHGRDFAQEEGLELHQSMFVLFSPMQAARFQKRFGSLDFRSIDFRRFSKVLSPQLKRYDFSFSQLLH